MDSIRETCVFTVCSPTYSWLQISAFEKPGSLPYRAALDAALPVATAVRDGRPPVVATPYPQVQQRLRRHGR